MNSASLTIGTVRNLTPQFKRLRDEHKRTHNVGEQEGDVGPLLPPGFSSSTKDPEAGSSAPRPVPAWVHKTEKVRTELGALKEKLDRLKEAHSKALKVTFDTDDDAQSTAEALTRELQTGFKRVNDEIKALQAVPGTDDAQVREQVQRQLGRALMVLTREFRGEETRYLNKLDERRGFAAGSSLAIVETAIAESEAALEQDPGFTLAQTEVVDAMAALAEERGKEIQTIVESITELAAIMRDMAVLVVEQGTILDRIDHNIQEVAAKIETGVEHIGAAATTQKKSQMFLCIIALIVIVVLLLIIVIIRQSLK